MPLRSMATSTLLDEAAAGNDAAVHAICERLRPRLTAWSHGRLPRYARDLLQTEDIVQVAMESTLRKLETFDNRRSGSFLAYMKTAVMNRIRSEIRRLKAKPKKVELNEAIPDTRMSPLDRVLDRETQDRYSQALQKLSALEQELIIGRLELQMSFRELALHTGKPSAGAARQATNRAIEKIAKVMKDDEA